MRHSTCAARVCVAAAALASSSTRLGTPPAWLMAATVALLVEICVHSQRQAMRTMSCSRLCSSSSASGIESMACAGGAGGWLGDVMLARV